MINDRMKAIVKADVLRKGNLTAERHTFKNTDENIDAKFITTWERRAHASISAAKKHVRSIGIGVALQDQETLPG